MPIPTMLLPTDWTGHVDNLVEAIHADPMPVGAQDVPVFLIRGDAQANGTNEQVGHFSPASTVGLAFSVDSIVDEF